MVSSSGTDGCSRTKPSRPYLRPLVRARYPPHPLHMWARWAHPRLRCCALSSTSWAWRGGRGGRGGHGGCSRQPAKLTPKAVTAHCCSLGPAFAIVQRFNPPARALVHDASGCVPVQLQRLECWFAAQQGVHGVAGRAAGLAYCPRLSNSAIIFSSAAALSSSARPLARSANPPRPASRSPARAARHRATSMQWVPAALPSCFSGAPASAGHLRRGS